jgi:hypothetical protein
LRLKSYLVMDLAEFYQDVAFHPVPNDLYMANAALKYVVGVPED